MPLEGEAKKQYNKEYATRKKIENSERQRSIEDAESTKIRDEEAAGKRHLSEVMSYVDLARLFHGVEKEDEEGEVIKALFKPSTSKIFGKKITFDEWLEFRDKCRTDGFFLGKEVLKRDLLTEHVHRPVFDQFVPKNFKGVYYEGYTLSDVHNALMDHHEYREKELMLLDPRANLKSTADGIDAVQWLLNCPDIRIFLMCGEDSLAESFLAEIKKYFTLAKGQDPTDFHLLFPEYIISGRAASAGTPMKCPARKHDQKEPSLWVDSVTSNLSGWHCDIKKGDDVVTDRNSNNADTRQKLKEKFDGTDELVDAWGFIDNIGTRYWTDDWYGTRLESREKAPLRYFCRPCWTVHDEFKDVPLKELTLDMVTLLFPERMTGGVLTEKSVTLAWKDLQSKLHKNERSFRNQQLNEPTDAVAESDTVVTFTEKALTEHSYPSHRAPKVGDIYITWDWAYTDGKSSDWSAGAAGRIYQREDGEWGISVLEVLCGKWKPSELAFQIVMFNKKWNPKRTLIEETICADLLKLELHRRATMHSVFLDIFWKRPDMHSDAKRNRIKSLQIKLENDLLWFVHGAWLEQTFEMFVKYTGLRKNRGRKDDIPDAISFLAYFCPRR